MMASTPELERNSIKFRCFTTVLTLLGVHLLIYASCVHSSSFKEPKRAHDLNANYIVGGSFPVFLSEKNETKCQSGKSQAFLGT